MGSCGECKKYGVLHTPREIADGIFIYGFCFKDFQRSYGSIYPVYIPQGGTCKEFDKKKEEKEDYEYEMTQDFKCECCKKALIGKITGCIEKNRS